MTVTDLVTDEAEPDGPCPACGRESERAVWERQMSRLRARSALTTSLAREPGLTTTEICEAVSGVRSVSEVLKARDTRVNAPHREEDQK